MKKISPIIEQARKDFDFSCQGFKENRKNYKDDTEFTFKSIQWPEQIRQDREAKNRPCLTSNKLKKFVKNTANDIRQNMPTVKFRPVDSVADPIIAEVLNDIKRSINNAPEAKMADKNAVQCALGGGFGYYRLVPEWEEDGFNQVIRKKRIANALSVYMDPGARDYLYADGRFGFVLEKMAKDEFKRLYPKASCDNWDATDADFNASEWAGDDWIVVAEYYKREYYEKTIVQMEDGAVYELKDNLTKELLENQTGKKVAKERVYKDSKIMWYKITGMEVIEGPIEIPSRYIPIIPVLGDEESIDGTRIFYSLIREAKDPQRMYNYWRTMAAELIALAPKAPYIATAEQIEGYEEIWAAANNENYSYLPYNHIPNQPRPQRERPADIPAAAVNEANIAGYDIMDSMGKYQASVGQPSNERSGRAILERKKEGDANSFDFVDNLNMSIIYEGMILADMIPRIYDNERVMRMRGDDGQERVWEINKVIKDPRTLDTIVLNDLSIGKYDVEPEIGPGYATKRAEIADSLLGVLQFAPNTVPVILPRLAKMLDMPESQAISEEIKALLQPGQSPEGQPSGPPPAIGENLPMG